MKTQQSKLRQQAVFVTGTDTGVGKTEVSLLLMRSCQQQGFIVNGMKPFASGAKRTALGLRNGDAEQLWRASTLELSYEEVNPWVFEPAIAPHIAAEEVGVSFDWTDVVSRVSAFKQRSDLLVIEGVGGWHVPIDRHHSTEDFVAALKVPVIMVVGLKLGCLNHAVLTYQAIIRAGVACTAWVANQIDPSMERVDENIATLERMIDAPLLGRIPYHDKDVCLTPELFFDINNI